MNGNSAPLGGDPRQADGILRAQLGEISAASQLLLTRAREEDKKYLAMINRAAFRCARALREEELARRLDGGRESGGEAAELTGLELVGWCRERCAQIAALLETVELTLDFVCTEEELMTLADRELLGELLYALISNAAKAVGPGGRLTVTLSRREDSAVLTVGDQGGGVAGEALDRLGDGEHLPDLTPGAGSGLGLRLCRAIAQVHGGRFVLDTGSGAGTRAAATIPIRAGEGGSFHSRWPEDDADRALEALSDVLPLGCFMG